MRWRIFLLYLLIILVLFGGFALLYPFYLGWTLQNLTTIFFIEGLAMFILGACLSVRLCDDMVYTHKPLNPALIREVEENPRERRYGFGEGSIAFFAASGIFLVIAALLYLIALFLQL